MTIMTVTTNTTKPTTTTTTMMIMTKFINQKKENSERSGLKTGTRSKLDLISSILLTPNAYLVHKYTRQNEVIIHLLFNQRLCILLRFAPFRLLKSGHKISSSSYILGFNLQNLFLCLSFLCQVRQRHYCFHKSFRTFKQQSECFESNDCVQETYCVMLVPTAQTANR